MDRFTEDTTPTPDGPGVVWYCGEYGGPFVAKMPTSFDHAGLGHATDPNAGFSGGVNSSDGTFKGSTSNPGLVPVDSPGSGVFRGSTRPA